MFTISFAAFREIPNETQTMFHSNHGDNIALFLSNDVENFTKLFFIF